MPQVNMGSQRTYTMQLRWRLCKTLQNHQKSTCDVRSAGINPTIKPLIYRRVLASSSSFLKHKPPEESSSNKLSYAQVASTPRGQSDSSLHPQCAHFFLEPQGWMQETIDKGELDGKLECPKCSAKVGSYAWQGIRCSCGTWVTPSFSLAKSKVDEVKRVNVNATTGVLKPHLNRNSVRSRA